MSDLILVLAVRSVHILSSVLWAGFVILVGFWFMKSSPDPAKSRALRQSMVNHGAKIIAPAAVFSLLTGIYLFRHLHSGAWMNAEKVLALGAATAVISFFTGAIGSGPAEKKLAKMDVARSQGRLTSQMESEIEGLEHRVKISARLTATLLVVSVVAMATARLS